MADGLFDDLVPERAAPSKARAGLFDDLVPDARLAPRPAVPNADFSGVSSRVLGSSAGDLLGSAYDPAAIEAATAAQLAGAPLPTATEAPISAVPELGLLEGLTAPLRDPLGLVRSLVDRGGEFVRGIGQADVLPAIRRGAVDAAASAIQAGGDLINRTVQQNPLAVLAQATGDPRAAEAFRDPLGAQAASRQAASIGREVDIDRQIAMQELGRPGVSEFLLDPNATARLGERLVTQGAESIPAFALALATRNPELGANLLGGVTGAQEYADLIAQGVPTSQAIEAAALSALAERAGEGVSLPKVMARGRLGDVLGATLAEGGQELPVSLSQTNIQDIATGRETPLGEQILQGLEAAATGAGLGLGGYTAANAPSLLAARRPPAAAEFTPDVDARELLGGPITEQAPPPARAAALPTEQPRRPALATLSPAAEPMADLDALLDQLAPRAEAPSPAASPVEPPTAAPMGGEAAATQKPRVTLAAVQAEQARRADEAARQSEVEAAQRAFEQGPGEGVDFSNPERAPQAKIDEALALSEADYLEKVNPSGETTDETTSTQLAEELQDRDVPSRAVPVGEVNDITLYADGDYLYAADGDRVVGVLGAKPSGNEFAVDPEYRGKGVGTAMMRELLVRDPFALSGGLSPSAEKTRLAALRQLREESRGEAVAAEPVPTAPKVAEVAPSPVGVGEAARQAGAVPPAPEVSRAAGPRPQPARLDEPVEATDAGIDLSKPTTSGFRSAKIGDTAIDYGVSRDGETAEIITVRTPAAKRGQGSARAALQAVIDEADRNGVTLFLTAEPLGKGGPNAKQLRAFYQSFGFRDNSGKKRDFRSRAGMVRDPQVRREDMGTLAREEPQELTNADLTDAERAAFDRQRAVGDRTATLRAAVDQALGPVAAKVRYLRSWRDLPQGRLRNGVESRLRQRGGKGQTSALFDPKTGDVYLFTDANPSPERAVFNVLHEIAGHQGLRAFLGAELDKALDLAAQNPTVMAVAEAIALERGIDASTDAGQRLAVEEALAELAAAVRTGNYDLIADRYGINVPPGIRERVKAAIDNFLRRLKALLQKATGQEFTDEDVRELLEAAWQAVEGGPTLADTSSSAASVLENVEPDERAEARASIRMTQAAAEASAEVRRNDLSQTLPAGRGTIGWQYDDSAWIGTKGQLSNARARLQDKMIAWRDVQKQIASQVGEAIPDTANVYRLENLMHGRVSTGIERIERAQVEPLIEAMRKAGVSTETLEEYLYARHAKERNADIAAKNPAMQDGGSGMTNAEADQILADADRAKLEPLARRVDAIVRSTRQRLLDAGLITQQSFDAMESQYSAYVPLRGKRVAETDFQPSEGGAGRGIDTRRNPVREALGRGAGNRADNILGEVIGDAQRSVILSEKARVGRAVLRLVLTHPNPTLWQVEPVQTERTTDANGDVYERVVHDWSDPSIIAVKHRGKTYRVQINNVPLALALSNVGIDQMGAVSRAAGAINRYFSAVLTKYNPAFLPVNATRDAIFGMTAMAAEHGELAALDAALHYPQAAAAAFRHSIGRPGRGQWDTWVAEFADAGGRTGYVAMPSVEDLSRQIGKGSLSSYSPEGVKRAAKAVADALGSMNDAVENALRLSAYVTLRKRGESIDAAASYAKDLTVNFNRKGYDSSRLNAWFLFYNAGIQGAKRASDVLRKPKAWGYVGGLMAAQTIAAMYAMGLEDEDGEPLWNKVPDHVKRRNLVMVLPDGGVFTVPMPYGFNVFTYLAGRVPAAVTDRDEKRSNRAATVAADMLSTATESFFPVPVGDGALGLLPTVLRIPVNIQTNRDDFGREIRRESMSKFDVPRASMGRPDTLELFKLAAQGMNRVGGGDKYTPPDLAWFDVAPEDMEYLLSELGGGAGKFAIDVATVGQQLTGGELAPALKPQDIPITGRFVSSIDQQAAAASLFYERRDAINRSLERVRDVYAERGAAAAESALKAAPELTGAAFKRRKKDSPNGEAGSVIESNGRPQIIVGKDDSVFGRYKAAEEVIEARNEGVRHAYTLTPASLIPTPETRLRDANVRQQNVMRQRAQHDLNAAWVRDVVGSAE